MDPGSLAALPVAVVLFHREYEVLFLPCVGQMADAGSRALKARVRGS